MTLMKTWVPLMMMILLPFLGDPEPEFFGEITLPSISLIGVAASQVANRCR